MAIVGEQNRVLHVKFGWIAKAGQSKSFAVLRIYAKFTGMQLFGLLAGPIGYTNLKLLFLATRINLDDKRGPWFWAWLKALVLWKVTPTDVAGEWYLPPSGMLGRIHRFAPQNLKQAGKRVA